MTIRTLLNPEPIASLPRSDVVRGLVHKLKSGLSPAAVLIQGDSTANGTDEWFYLTMQWLAQQFPLFTVTQRLWDDAAQQYAAPTFLQTGSAGARFFRTLDSAQFLTAADSAQNSTTGDIDVRVKVAMDDWTPAGPSALAAKFGGAGNRSWRIELLGSGELQLSWSTDGTAMIDKYSGVAVPFANGAVGWVRAVLDVDNGAGGNDVKFYTSTDGSAWSQLGSTQTTAGTTSIFDSTMGVQFPGRGGSGYSYPANWYALKVFAGSVPVVDIDAQSIPAAGSFTDYVANTWTPTNPPISLSGSPELSLWNASTSGMGIGYSNDSTRFTKQTPFAADLAFVSYSHNDGTGVAYRAQVKQLADALVAKWVDVGIVLSTQNPRKSPADTIAEHAIRCQQIASFAVSQRYGLVDPYAAFLATGAPDALVASDGIHPTASGSQLWAAAARGLIEGWI